MKSKLRLEGEPKLSPTKLCSKLLLQNPGNFDNFEGHVEIGENFASNVVITK
jgi:hypothetical protein